MLAGGDALAGAAGGRQAVRHAGRAALTGGLHLVHHREAGLDGRRQVAKRYLAGGGAPTRHKPRGGHPERRVSAAVAVRGLAGHGGPGGGLPGQAGLHGVGAVARAWGGRDSSNAHSGRNDASTVSSSVASRTVSLKPLTTN